MITAAEILAARILVVDDLEANIRLLEKMLAGAGYTSVTSTMDPKAVCALHREHRYDLILLDLLMPGMDGFAVLEGLKAIEPEGYVPVLVVTAQPGHKLRALEAGAKDFISKPFDLVELKARIHNLLEVRLLYQLIAQHNKLLEQTVLERTAELRESEERFRRLTELSSDWYWEQADDGRVTKVSGPALEMLGIRADGSTNPGTDGNGARWNEAERAELEANIAARKPFLDYIYSRANPDGTVQYFQVSAEPMFNASGRYLGYRGIGMEVTGRMGRQ
ncbi:MAG: response regulator [Sinimarinibacterium sp.]|jgi:PAS domain S-box-containing protein